MSWFLAFAGFALLIILHELGHFAAAKAVGMRVERFSLFFGRTKLRFQRGETEYGVGWLPLGGFVKITGMNPQEEIPAEAVSRAYYRQPVWKRIVVISAGPAVNIVLAFVILMGLYWFSIGDVREARADEPHRPDHARLPGRQGAARGRPHRRRRRPPRQPDRAAQADRLAPLRRRPAQRLPRRRAGRDRGRRGGEERTVQARPVYSAREQAAADRLRLRRRRGRRSGR